MAVLKSFIVQSRVIGALMLRDVQTRFGGRSANYIIAVAWPLTHMGVLLVIYTLSGRVAPIGQSAPLFFATGLVPFILFNYPSRQIMMSLMVNGPLLNFPVVKTTDVMIARALLETITGFAVVIIFAFILWSLGVDIVPRYPQTAVSALGAVLLFSISVGVVNCVLQIFIKIWFIIWIIFMLMGYLLSGVIFVTEYLPERAKSILVWNPLLQCVEWFRSAYFEGYGRSTLDKEYLLLVSLALLTVGLSAERFTRRWAIYT